MTLTPNVRDAGNRMKDCNEQSCKIENPIRRGERQSMRETARPRDVFAQLTREAGEKLQDHGLEGEG